MKADEALNYFNNLWEEMIVNFKLFVKTGDQEKLHKFRVTVKKLKSFIVLLESFSDKRLSKKVKSVKTVFKQCGIVRDAYLNIQTAEDYHFNTTDFKKQQHQLQIDVTDNIVKHHKAFLNEFEQLRIQLSADIKGISHEDVEVFYYRQLYQIAYILAQRKFNDQLHACRKRIKHLLYNHNITGKAGLNRFGINIEYFKALQTAIGNWHDKVLLSDLLSTNKLADDAALGTFKKQLTDLQNAIISQAQSFWIKALK